MVIYGKTVMLLSLEECFLADKVIEIQLYISRKVLSTGTLALSKLLGNITSDYTHEAPDYYLAIAGTVGGLFDPTRVEQNHSIGYAAAEAAWPEIKKVLEESNG